MRKRSDIYKREFFSFLGFRKRKMTPSSRGEAKILCCIPAKVAETRRTPPPQRPAHAACGFSFFLSRARGEQDEYSKRSPFNWGFKTLLFTLAALWLCRKVSLAQREKPNDPWKRGRSDARRREEEGAISKSASGPQPERHFTIKPFNLQPPKGKKCIQTRGEASKLAEKRERELQFDPFFSLPLLSDGNCHPCYFGVNG